MNKTNFEHAGFAILIQTIFLLFGFVFPNNILTLGWVGATFASAFFLGREHAQREYKICDPSKLIGYEAFDIWRWKIDAILDLVFPIIATVIIAITIQLFL